MPHSKPTLLGLCGKAGVGKDEVARMIAGRHVASFNGAMILVPREPVVVGEAKDALVLGAVQCAFADPLKMIARGVWGFTSQQLWGSSEHRNAPDTRYPRQHDSHIFDVDAQGARCSRCGCGPFHGDVLEEHFSERCESYLSPREALQRLGTEVGRNLWPGTWVRLLFENLPEATLCVISDVRFDDEARAIRERGGKIWRVVRPTARVLTGSSGAHASEAGVSDDLVDSLIVNDGTLSELRFQVEVALRLLRYPM